MIEKTDGAIREIREVISRYARSIGSADLELAASIWRTSADVSFIHPRGHERGWGQVKENFYKRTMGERFSKRELHISDLAIHVYGDAAVAEFYWRFEAKFRDDGSALTTEGRETQVLYRDDQRGWLLTHVHYSSMPVTGDREGF